MKIDRILVAYDGSEAAFRALEQAVERAFTEGSRVGIVTVRPAPSTAAGEAACYVRDHGIEADVHTPAGDPATEIRRVAEEGAYDTIYVGTRGRGSLVRAIEGSVSGTVAEEAEVTVVVAR